MANPTMGNAVAILAIYQRFEAVAGTVLIASNFLAIDARLRLSAADLQGGIDYGRDLGWFVFAQNGGIELTEIGYHFMEARFANG